MVRFLLFLLGLLALGAGAASAYLGGAEHEKIVDRHAAALLGASARSLPLALDADEALHVVREVAQRTPFQFTLADAAIQGAAPEEALLDRAERTVQSLTEEVPAVLVGTRGGVRGIRDGEAVDVGEGALALVAKALEGNEAASLVSLDGKLFRARAVPVGAGALAVAFPVNDAFARELGTALGTELTFLHEGKAVASTLGAIERAELAVASMEGEEPFGAGRRPEAYRLFGALDLPLFAPWKGTMRGQARPSGEATIIHATSVEPLLDAFVEQEKRALLLAALIGGLAFVFALFGGGGKRRVAHLTVVADLAERAAAGDANAHAPEHLAGDLGRLSRAINRLARKNRREEAAAALDHGLLPPEEVPEEENTADFADSFRFPDEPDGVSAPAGPPPLPTQAEPAEGVAEEPDLSAASAGPLDEPTGPTAFGDQLPGLSAFGEEAESPAEEEAPAAAPAPEGFESSPLAGFAMGHPEGDEAPAEAEEDPWDQPTRPLPFVPPPGEMEAPSAPPPLAAPESVVPAAEPTAVAPLAPAPEEPAPEEPAPEPPAAAAPAWEPPAAPPPAEDPETAQFREVYENFLAIREQCGESSAGISFERFSAKLRANRAQLMEKYRCVDVRFTVYVKDGRAALKASPIGMNQASGA